MGEMIDVRYRIILIMICLLLSVSEKSYAHSETNYAVRINEFALKLEYEILFIEQEPYIPIREVFEFLGGEVLWYEDSKSVEVKYETQKLSFTPGRNVMFMNEVILEKEMFSFLWHDKTYVSCRVLCELFSFSYSHLEFNKTIYFGVKTEDVRREYTVEYFVYDFPLPMLPTSYSITIRTDGSCVLSYGKEYPETLIYPKVELLDSIFSMLENESILPYEKEENVVQRTDEKKVMLKICKEEANEEFLMDSNIYFLDALFGERVGKYEHLRQR